MALKRLTVYIDDTDVWRETFCPVDNIGGAPDLENEGLFRCANGHLWKYEAEQ